MRRGRALRCATSSTGSACRATATTASSVPARSRAGLSRAGRVRPCFTSARSAICRFSRGSISLRRRRERRLCGLLGPVRRHRRDAGRLSAACFRRCAPVRCSWSAPIPMSWSSGGTNWCIARARSRTCYAAMGGEVLYCGKPHAPIYRECLDRAAALRGGVSPPLTRVLAIGDLVRTDLTGAAAFGLDALFVISGTACRTARRARRAGSPEPSGDLRRSRRRAEGGDAKARVVMSATGSGAGRRGAALTGSTA